jgi:hypothetical protein
MAQHYRHDWGFHRSNIFNLQWDAIRDNSVVVITASEGNGPNAQSPGRFVGDAQFSVSNVAPHAGGVTYRVDIGHYVVTAQGDSGFAISFLPWPDPLRLFVDYTVF